MYRRKTAALFCAGLLLASAALRAGLEPELRTGAIRAVRKALECPALFQAVLFLETGYKLPDGQAVPAPAELPRTDETAKSPAGAGPEDGTVSPEAAPTAPASDAAGTEDASASGPEASGDAEQPAAELPAPFTAADADGISMRGNCTYKIDKQALLTGPLDWDMEQGPKILIIHSHSCEAYTQCEGHAYLPDANYRTLQKEESVIAVGDALARELEALGVTAVHDRSYNDYPSYNSSYAVAREKIAQWLEEYPSIVMVLDLHRDALEKPVRETAVLDGVICAPLMLVVGTDEGGLNHPHWQRNLSCALKLQALANREEPDLFKALSFRKERFNGDMTPGSVIVEVGSTENTLPEAEASMPYLARFVARLLQLAESEAPA